MIFQLSTFVVLGLDEELDRYAVIHYNGQTSPRMYSKWGSREFVKKIMRLPALSNTIAKEELLAIEDAISNSDLRDDVCAKDLREARLAAIAKSDKQNREFMKQLLELDPTVPDTRQFH